MKTSTGSALTVCESIYCPKSHHNHFPLYLSCDKCCVEHTGILGQQNDGMTEGSRRSQCEHKQFMLVNRRLIEVECDDVTVTRDCWAGSSEHDQAYWLHMRAAIQLTDLLFLLQRHTLAKILNNFYGKVLYGIEWRNVEKNLLIGLLIKYKYLYLARTCDKLLLEQYTVCYTCVICNYQM